MYGEKSKCLDKINGTYCRDYLVDEINEKDITFDSNINFFESTPIENFNNNIRILNDE